MGDRPAGHGPDGEPPKRSGPPRTELDQRQRAKLLELIEQGSGLDKALRHADIRATYRAYRNTAEADPDFRAEVASARRAADQTLDEFGFLTAQTIGEGDLLVELWNRRDKARELNLSRADRHRERAQDRRDRLRKERADREAREKELATRVYLAKIAADARRGDAKPPESPFDTRNLTDEEIAELDRHTAAIDRLVAKMRPAPPA